MSKHKQMKREKFIRLAEKRTTAVLKQIELVENLLNKNNYDYKDEEVIQIIDAIDNRLKQLKKTFKSQGEVNIKFKFNDKDS